MDEDTGDNSLGMFQVLDDIDEIYDTLNRYLEDYNPEVDDTSYSPIGNMGQMTIPQNFFFISHLVALSLTIFSLIFIIFCWSGLTRNTYLAKGIIELMTYFLLIAAFCKRNYMDPKPDLELILKSMKSVSKLDFGTDGKENSIESFISPFLEATRIILNISTQLWECMTLTFIYELYLCTYKMEVRKQKILVIIKKFTYSLGFTLLLVGAHQIALFLVTAYLTSESILVFLWDELDPLEQVKKIIFTFFILYFCSYIVISLKKSRQFRKQCGSNSEDKSLSFIILICVIMAIQVATCAIKLIYIVLVALLLTSEDLVIDECFKNEENYVKPSCLYFKLSALQPILIKYCYLSELCFVTLIAIISKCKCPCLGKK